MRTPNLARPIQRMAVIALQSADGVRQSDCCGGGQCCLGTCLFGKCIGVCVPNIGQC